MKARIYHGTDQSKKDGEGRVSSRTSSKTRPRAIVGTFAKLTASKDFELRKTVRGAGGSYHVVKNKLAARAAEGHQGRGGLQGLKGVSLGGLHLGDPVALAKALSTWVKDNAEFTFKLGIVDGKVINVRGDQASWRPCRARKSSSRSFCSSSIARAASGHCDQCHRPRSRRRHQPGRREGQVRRHAAAAAPAAPQPRQRQHRAEAPAAEAAAEAPAAEAAAAHVEESAAGEQPSGAAQPENADASQAGEAAATDPVEG